MNNKDTAGSMKAALKVVPPSLMIAASGPLKHGADKYGAFNWRTEPISLMGHLEAVYRHLFAYQDGEDNAWDSNMSHLDHALAGLAVIVDAAAYGTLKDDRVLGPSGLMLREREIHDKLPPPEAALPLKESDWIQDSTRISLKDVGIGEIGGTAI